METVTQLLGCAGLLVVLLICYLTGACLFGARSHRNGIGLTIVWFTTGLCFASLFFLLSKFAGFGLAIFACAPVLILFLYAYRRPDLRVALDYEPREFGAAFAISFASTIPVLIMGARMGAGAFPAEFFSADSPYFLHHAYALATTAAYPPPSFEVYGFSFKYHYGAQAFVALTSVLTGLKPHFVMFVVVEPFLLILTGLLAYDISRQLTGRPGAALMCLLIFLFGSKQYLINYLNASAWEFVLHVEAFNFRFPNLPNVAGLLIALSVARCLIEFGRRNMRLAALFLLSVLPVFKIPYLIPISAGAAFIYCYELRKQFRIDLLLEIGGAALLALIFLVLFSYSTVVGTATARFNVLGFLDMTALWQQHTQLVVLVLVVATVAATRHKLSDGMTRLLMLALSPYVLFSMCSFEIFEDNHKQIFDLALSLAVLFAAIYVVSAWSAGVTRTPLRRIAAIAAAVCLTAPGMISLLNHIRIVAFHPERGHEYVDNRSVADALRRIPLENSLTVTNDLRYPADGYFRKDRQFQLAGIFGHRNFASNMAYGGFSREEIDLYSALARLFQSAEWLEKQIAFLRQKAPITHLLIHKHYRHAKHIPLELIYENNDYAVYRF